MVADGVGDTWYVTSADLEIKGGGQEPYLAKAELHTRSARTTRVQGEDTVFMRRAVPQSFKATIIVRSYKMVISWPYNSMMG